VSWTLGFGIPAAAMLLAIAFFLPWVNTGVSNPSGLSIASGASVLDPLGIPTVGLTGLLYLVPVLAIVALALAFLRQSVSGLTAVGAATSDLQATIQRLTAPAPAADINALLDEAEDDAATGT
jgi:hypothetical protein